MMLTALGLTAWACATNVPLSDFDTSCVHDADCIEVQVGDACECTCGGNAAINVSSEAAYNSLFAERRSHCQSAAFCDCSPPVDGGAHPVCAQGQCAIAP
jgi:hypothetical protein